MFLCYLPKILFSIEFVLGMSRLTVLNGSYFIIIMDWMNHQLWVYWRGCLLVSLPRMTYLYIIKKRLTNNRKYINYTLINIFIPKKNYS